MRLREYLDEDSVLLGLTASDRAGALRQVADRLAARGLIPDATAAAAALLARESAHTTCLGNGAAVPHASVSGLTEPVFAVAIAPSGIHFGEAPPETVRVLFLLLSPPERSHMHIRLLARIARLVRDPGFIDVLAQAGDAESVLREVERVDARHV